MNTAPRFVPHLPSSRRGLVLLSVPLALLGSAGLTQAVGLADFPWMAESLLHLVQVATGSITSVVESLAVLVLQTVAAIAEWIEYGARAKSDV